MLSKNQVKLIVANSVVVAVSPTDNSVFAFESDDIKLEMFPPGHDATRIIPIATVGVM